MLIAHVMQTLFIPLSYQLVNNLSHVIGLRPGVGIVSIVLSAKRQGGEWPLVHARCNWQTIPKDTKKGCADTYGFGALAPMGCPGMIISTCHASYLRRQTCWPWMSTRSWFTCRMIQGPKVRPRPWPNRSKISCAFRQARSLLVLVSWAGLSCSMGNSECNFFFAICDKNTMIIVLDAFAKLGPSYPWYIRFMWKKAVVYPTTRLSHQFVRPQHSHGSSSDHNTVMAVRPFAAWQYVRSTLQTKIMRSGIEKYYFPNSSQTLYERSFVFEK